jgi:hypothetical protein
VGTGVGGGVGDFVGCGWRETKTMEHVSLENDPVDATARYKMTTHHRRGNWSRSRSRFRRGNRRGYSSR